MDKETERSFGSDPERSPRVATEEVGPKKGIFGRAVDSFKPPVGQKGWTPNPAHHTTVRTREVPEDEKDGHTVLVDENYDDNGGLKRALHSRHLQVCILRCGSFLGLCSDFYILDDCSWWQVCFRSLAPRRMRLLISSP